jgi:membrane-bound lytic murein transglycosylase D
VDERNDPYLATGAAVQHLSDLYREFGSWELALAAYNSGAGRVERAMRRANGNNDFWTIRRFLRRETRNYVPALWAVVVATKNPEAYGLPRFPDDPTCLARVKVVGALDLDVLAERGNLDGDQLAELNPALTRKLTPAVGSYQLAVPCGRETQVAEAIAAIPPADRVRRFLHVVRSGDTLGAIARRYGSTVDTIMPANDIRNVRALRIGQTLVVPRGTGAVSTRVGGGRRPAGEKVAAAESRERYVVRRGDTLFAIARRFGTSTEELQRRNRLPDTTIRPGDVLYLTR